jgi:hypothetical protein
VKLLIDHPVAANHLPEITYSKLPHLAARVVMNFELHIVMYQIFQLGATDD